MIFLPPVYSLIVVTSSVEYHLGIVINMGEGSGIMRSLINNNLVPRILSYSFPGAREGNWTLGTRLDKQPVVGS